MNKQLLLGNLVADPEQKQSKTTVIAKARVAVNTDGKRTDFHNLKFFGKTAGFVLTHAKKGSKVFIEGKTIHDQFDGDDGIKKYFSEVIVDNIQLLTGWKDDDVSPSEEGNAKSEPVKTEEPPF